jgi:hypothetical protein
MIEASLILCDFAERDPTGKVHLLGAGWTSIGPAPAPHAVVLFVKIPPQVEPIQIMLRLLDADNQVVTVPGSAGVQRLELSGQIEVPPDPSVPDDVPGQGTFAVNATVLPFQPGKYSWVLEVDGKEEARASFLVRKAVQPDPAAGPTASP